MKSAARSGAPPAGPGHRHQVRHGRRTIRISAGDAKSLARARYALWKNPENLTGRQEAKLAWIDKTHPCLCRAYLLKEGLRTVFRAQRRSRQARPDPLAVLGARCRIPEFTELAKKIRATCPASTPPWTTA